MMRRPTKLSDAAEYLRFCWLEERAHHYLRIGISTARAARLLGIAHEKAKDANPMSVNTYNSFD